MKPWMSDDEIQKISGYLDTNDVCFEWGSGGSTLFFSKFVKHYTSIEYDINWYNKITDCIYQNNLTNITYLYCPPDNDIKLPIFHEQSNPKDFISYINIIDNLSNIKYDKIFIDGRSRVACAKKALSYIDKNSIIFVHDFFDRKNYLPILEDYMIVDSVKHGQSLAILKKKT
jgi:hypothetical protein